MNRLSTAICSVAGVLTVTSAGPALAASITLAHPNAIGSQITERANEFVECVASADVDLTVQHLPAAQLGTDREVLEQIKLGAVAMTITDTAFLAELEPELAVFQLPFIFKGWDHAESAITGKPAELFSGALRERQGLETLALIHNGFRHLLTRDTPIRALEDMKPVQFRSPPLPLWLTMFERLEVQPVTVPWNDVYSAMQTGLVDGLETTAEGMVNSKTYEVGKYVTLTGHMYSLNAMVISEKALDGLNDAQSAALTDCAATFQKESNTRVRGLEEASLDTMREAGLEIIEVDKEPFQNALRPAWPDMMEQSDGATALMDAIAAAE